ncbi:MAG: hypothetical protein DA328_07590 [Nitrososphaeraceae archaeon]|nr:hypothetical protein [Nitrososphaeraceae archaeon]
MYPIPDRHVTSFRSLNIENVVEVLHKLNPKKYRYEEYITIIIYVHSASFKCNRHALEIECLQL